MQPPFFCNTYSIYLISSGCFSVISYKLHLAWPWRGLPSPARSVMVLHLPFCVGLHGKCIEGFESLKLYVCSHVLRVIWICKYMCIYIYLCLYIYDCIRIYVGIMVSKVIYYKISMFGTVMPFYISLVGLKGMMIIIRKPLCSTISWSQRPRLRDVRRNCTRFLSVSAHWLEMQKKQIVKALDLGWFGCQCDAAKERSGKSGKVSEWL